MANAEEYEAVVAKGERMNLPKLKEDERKKLLNEKFNSTEKQLLEKLYNESSSRGARARKLRDGQ